MKENKEAEKLMGIYKRAEKKFIITSKEAEVIEFFRDLRCIFCNKIPTTYSKNIRIGKDIYCEFCYNKLMGNKR